MSHPHLFVTSDQVDNLRSLHDVRQGIGQGHSQILWKALLEKVEAESREAPWTPYSPLPERSATSIKKGNPDYGLVARICTRIIDTSLVALITGERHWADAVLHQIRCLYDPVPWPEYEDYTHLAHGDHCSLRRGQLSVALGLAYDWLYQLLTPEERRWIIDNFDTRLTLPFKAGLAAPDRFTTYRNNFVPVIYGGFQIAAMAFGEDYAETPWIHEVCEPKMNEYLGYFLGPDGEFDESVQYAASVDVLVHYLVAKQYHGRLGNPIADNPAIVGFFRWYMYFTLPPGRVVGFGDPAADMPPIVTSHSAAASALQDPTLQWYYEQYYTAAPDTHRKRSFELLYYNPEIKAVSPEGKIPLGRAYHHCARLVSSRSSWDPHSTISIVYGKASIEDNHSHPDWGQVCIDGYGERLIPDLGSPSGYPKTFPESLNRFYYNYQQKAHNILVFGHNETGGVSHEEWHRKGHFIHEAFDDNRGGTWTIDLTGVYDVAQRVTRTVVHLLPRIAVVIDDAQLKENQPISLRWHTLSMPQLETDGTFITTGERSRITGRMLRLDGDAEIHIAQHEYHEPYHTDALGDPMTQRREPYVELTAQDDHCRIATVFCVSEKASPAASWQSTPQGLSIDTPEGKIQVTIKGKSLQAINTATSSSWEVALK